MPREGIIIITVLLLPKPERPFIDVRRCRIDKLKNKNKAKRAISNSDLTTVIEKGTNDSF
jgi:hypothetical protein